MPSVFGPWGIGEVGNPPALFAGISARAGAVFPQFMKLLNRILPVAVLCSTLVAAYAQPHGGASVTGGPDFGGAMSKLFGENQAYSASIEMQMQMRDQTMTMPGKIAFDSGKARFEMAMSEAKGGQMSAQMAQHMKSMGMDRIVSVSLPDKKVNYVIYPDLKAYVEMPDKSASAEKTNANYKVESADLGKETVDGHPCVKSKVTVTDDENTKHEYTVWNATDLKKFPVKIETNDAGHQVTIAFKDIKLAKPDASLFTAPADMTKYNSPQELMQNEMMKKMGGGGGTGGMGGMPPNHP